MYTYLSKPYTGPQILIGTRKPISIGTSLSFVLSNSIKDSFNFSHTVCTDSWCWGAFAVTPKEKQQNTVTVYEVSFFILKGFPNINQIKLTFQLHYWLTFSNSYMSLKVPILRSQHVHKVSSLSFRPPQSPIGFLTSIWVEGRRAGRGGGQEGEVLRGHQYAKYNIYCSFPS